MRKDLGVVVCTSINLIRKILTKKGLLHNEFAAGYLTFGSTVRTPGDYTRYNHDTGEPYVPSQPLENTNEKIHASVRIRCSIPGHKPQKAGTSNETGNYSIPVFRDDNIQGWKVKGLPSQQIHTANMSLDDIHELQKRIRWIKDDKTEMEEDLISDVEWKLLKKLSPDVADNFFAYGTK